MGFLPAKGVWLLHGIHGWDRLLFYSEVQPFKDPVYRSKLNKISRAKVRIDLTHFDLFPLLSFCSGLSRNAETI